MSVAHCINERNDISRFVTGGNAIFTLVSKNTGKRYAYKVRKSDGNKPIFFVSVLYGSDNTNDYVYMGIIRDEEYSHGVKSVVTEDDVRNKSFAWFGKNLKNGNKLDQVEFWHEGRCACCGRRLTVPESIESGIGPECAKKM